MTEPNFADVILASMVKRVDTAVFTSIENVAEESFQGDSTVTLGLERDGVATVCDDQLGGDIPQEVKTALEESRTAIIEGDISAPTEP